jgi:hypothetical protein
MFQNSGAGTAVCLMIKKNIFEEVGGFDDPKTQSLIGKSIRFFCVALKD